MEQELFEIYSFYKEKEDKMNLQEYIKFLKDCEIYPSKQVEKIFNNFSLDKLMSFSSFKKSFSEIAMKNKITYDNLMNKIMKSYIFIKEIFQKKKEVLKRQEKLLKNEGFLQKDKIKIILEDMCFIGRVMKKEIEKEKKYNPKKFISIEEATKEKETSVNFCLGILAQELENLGITTVIEKEGNQTEESIKISEMVMQFIANGMIDRKKYGFHFDFGEKRNNELLKNKKEKEKFYKTLKKAISLQYGIKEENILITNPHEGSYIVEVIFLNEDFNKEIDISKFKLLCNNKEFKELCYLKDIHKKLIMDGCKLTPYMLDSEGNRQENWGVNEKRGGFNYIPPKKGWIGFGLKAKGKYDNGNDDWLAADGNKNEWAVAYHGVGCSNLEDVINKISTSGLKAGNGQAYENADDRFHPGNKVGRGIYCSPEPDVMLQYASYGKTETKVNGKQYRIGFMLRVKPDKIRSPKEKEDYWVLETDEMRPYRIVVKEI